MKIYAVDWATKKDFTVYDGKKVKHIANVDESQDKFLNGIEEGAMVNLTKGSIDYMPLPTLLLEEGGADTFKLKAFRAGFRVLTIPGKKIKDYRDSLSEEKSDEKDAELIYKFYESERGSANGKMTKGSIPFLPPSFLLFQEMDADIAEVKILFREHEDLKQTMVREKNKLFAFEKKYQLANVASNQGKKIMLSKKASIKEKEKQLIIIKAILKDKVKRFPIWNKHLADIKGVGPVIAAGLIGEIGNKTFDSKESIKHYAGIIPRSESTNFNRYLKVTLYQFLECVIKLKTPKWREMYDSIKAYYADKHVDWSKGKCNNFAKKFVESKFIAEYWRKQKELI